MALPRKSTRREFLQGETPPAAPRPQIGDDAEDDQRFVDPTEERYLVRIGRRAMACQFQVFLNAGQYVGGTEQAIEALDRVEQLEQVLTLFRDDSEVSRVNRTAAIHEVDVGCELSDLLSLSLQLCEATNGAFDITAGPLSEIWGFARRAGNLPAPDVLASTLEKVGSEHLHFDPQSRKVRFRQAGVQINFGGIGKGYAIDLSAQQLVAAGVNDFLFHGGNSSVLARGRRAGDNGLAEWSVGVLHPLWPERRLAEIFLRDQALSTSGSKTQSFHFQGRRYGHILDPRTGQPVEGILSATVLSDSAAKADALSTGLFVLGPRQAADYCRRDPDTKAILVLPGPSTASVLIETHNVLEDDWRLLDDTATVIVR